MATGADKLALPARHLLVRGMLAGAYLGIATSMAVTVFVETGYWIAGAILFPFGLVLAVLLGTELITGSFALLPCAVASGVAPRGLRRMLIHWGCVYAGNLLGGGLYAAALAMALTAGGEAAVPAGGAELIALAEATTTGYARLGAAGLLAAFAKGILCNWMVSLAIVAAFASTSVAGKALAICGPTLLFFSQGFEHAVVNMFVIPPASCSAPRSRCRTGGCGTRSPSRWAIWSGGCSSPACRSGTPTAAPPRRPNRVGERGGVEGFHR